MLTLDQYITESKEKETINDSSFWTKKYPYLKVIDRNDTNGFKNNIKEYIKHNLPKIKKIKKIVVEKTALHIEYIGDVSYGEFDKVIGIFQKSKMDDHLDTYRPKFDDVQMFRYFFGGRDYILHTRVFEKEDYEKATKLFKSHFNKSKVDFTVDGKEVDINKYTSDELLNLVYHSKLKGDGDGGWIKTAYNNFLTYGSFRQG